MKRKSTLENYLFVIPALAIFTVFYILPFFGVFQLSMYDWDGTSPSKFSEKLETLPSTVVFPDALKKTVYYDAKGRQLICNGRMRQQDQEYLLGLSGDVEYQKIIDRLYLKSQSARKFVKAENFKEVIFQDKNWWQAMLNGGYITLIALTFQNAFAFLLAMACDREIRLKRFYRLMFFLPPILSEIIVGMVWRLIIDDISGANLVNRMLGGVGLSSLARGWLHDEGTVLTTVAIIHCWKGFGWGFLIFLAGLQTIPRELYEAARVDGANAWKSFKNITFPLMIPVTITVAILTILGTMQAFALIMALLGGDFAGYASVPVLRIVASMLGSGRLGYACAQGITFGIILVAISFTQYRMSRKFRYA